MSILRRIVPCVVDLITGGLRRLNPAEQDQYHKALVDASIGSQVGPIMFQVYMSNKDNPERLTYAEQGLNITIQGCQETQLLLYILPDTPENKEVMARTLHGLAVTYHLKYKEAHPSPSEKEVIQ